MPTQFRSLRNFWCAGRGEVRIGDVLVLTDEQASELVALGDTVEPVHAADRVRVTTAPRISWEKAPAKTEQRLREARRPAFAVVGGR